MSTIGKVLWIVAVIMWLGGMFSLRGETSIPTSAIFWLVTPLIIAWLWHIVVVVRDARKVSSKISLAKPQHQPTEEG